MGRSTRIKVYKKYHIRRIKVLNGQYMFHIIYKASYKEPVMDYEDTFLVECENEHTYQMVIGECPNEHPCPFCGAAVQELEN